MGLPLPIHFFGGGVGELITMTVTVADPDFFFELDWTLTVVIVL